MKNKRRWIAAGAALAVLLLCAVGHGSVASTRATRPTAVFSETALAADAANVMTSTTGTNDTWCSGEHLFGDINGDGSVDNKDLGVLQRYINGWPIDSLVTTTTSTDATTTTTASTTTTTTTKTPEDTFKGTTYYVSSSTGDDGAEGTSEAEPVKTLEVAGQLGGPGDRVLFKRGDIWRGETIAFRSGVTYGAYGTGENPQFYGSAQNYSVKSNWKQDPSNSRIWYYDETFSEDIGGIVFNDGDDYAVRVFSMSDLNSKNEYCFSNGKVYLFSRNGNPAEQYSSIEFLPDIMIMNGYGISDVTVKDIIVKYAGRAGFQADGSIKNIRLENIDFSWIGGVLWGPQYGKVRLGNAINIWGSCQGFVVTNCNFYQIYDTAFTPQYACGSSNKQIVFENIEFSNNTVNKCHYGIELWISSDGENIGTIKNVKILNNVMRNAGGGWSANQRGEAAALTMASHFETMGHSCETISDILIKGNTFEMSAGTLIGSRWDKYTPVFEGNTFIQKKGNDFGYIGGPARYAFDDNIKSKILSFDKTATVAFSE